MKFQYHLSKKRVERDNISPEYSHMIYLAEASVKDYIESLGIVVHPRIDNWYLITKIEFDMLTLAIDRYDVDMIDLESATFNYFWNYKNGMITIFVDEIE